MNEINIKKRNNGFVFVFLGSILSVVLQGCTADTHAPQAKKIVETSSVFVTDNPNSIDSLKKYCQEEIENYYRDFFSKAVSFDIPELTLEGQMSYMDETFIIISFKEIVKYGSWHYSNSSFIFRKNREGQVIRVVCNEEDTPAGSGIDRELNYPKRVNGLPHIISDLNGDGKTDFIFESVTGIRDHQQTVYSFYLYTHEETLKRSILSIKSDLDQCGDGFCGTESQLSLYHFEFPPSIFVYKKEIRYNSATQTRFIMEEQQVTYKWNPKKEDFDREI